MDELKNSGLRGPWAQSELECSIGATEDRPTALMIQAQQEFNLFQSKRPNAYDGQLAGLRGAWRGEAGLRLDLVPVSFSWYLATRDQELKIDWPRADPIGTTTIVRTSDDHVLISKRSLEVDQNPGGLYFVGGFAEFTTEGQVDLFANACREVAEETGLQIQQIVAATRLLGLEYDPEFPHPEAFFEMRLAIAADALVAALQSFKHEEIANFSVVRGPEFLSITTADAPLTWSFKTGRRLFAELAATMGA
ncbi:NUDIX hydrolase [Mesorhizobium sp.]|uniref:NUDIX hydrolase n=1 Tax=Mesorhizobium sp. TaxID=1871066 RepID=UPI0025C4E5F9|nr:NUDIX hydrolase [Mesorhizobium sp.]